MCGKVRTITKFKTNFFKTKKIMECYYWLMLLLDCITAKTPYTASNKTIHFMYKYNSAIKIFSFLFNFFFFFVSFYGKQLFTENIFKRSHNRTCIQILSKVFCFHIQRKNTHTHTHIYVYQLLWLSNKLLLMIMCKW